MSETEGDAEGDGGHAAQHEHPRAEDPRLPVGGGDQHEDEGRQSGRGHHGASVSALHRQDPSPSADGPIHILSWKRSVSDLSV